MSGNKNKLIYSFKPLKGENPKVLILGTMPGKASLAKQEYYGYEYNAFWKIIFEILEKPFSSDYGIKEKLLKEKGIALWDTIESCQRKGSSDASIKNIKYNDIESFLENNPGIRAIFLNGKSAYNIFIKAIKNKIKPEIFIMPSTSPANTVKYDVKLLQWVKVKEFLY